MRNIAINGLNRRNSQASLVTGTKVGAAVFAVLYGVPFPLTAAVSDGGEALQEITVTATRRSETLESVPYSISVISAEQISAAGVTDLPSLSFQVPGLSMYDYGARFVGSEAPIIRGINATGSPARGFRTFEQDPVGTYIGNSPIDGYFQLDDIKQVEVLRGPQGTLYGAGALGGALRLIPNSPELNKFSGTIEAGASRLDHSSGTGYSVKGMINIPIGDDLAFRASAKYVSEPGWINAYGLFARTNNGLSGIPLLANPSDPVDSPPIYEDRNDWNFQKTFSSRASLLWKPSDVFNAELAVLHANVRGDGGPQVNTDFKGGPSLFDPTSNLPAGGRYQEFAQIDQPYSRYTNLVSLDASYDAGFATLSSTSSYHTTSGSSLYDSTYTLASNGGGEFLPYYAGLPTSPRAVLDYLFADSAHTFTEEIRLVSKADPSHKIDYVLGFFYENQTRVGAFYQANPGLPERSAAQGCTGPAYIGATFPNCSQVAGANDIDFEQIDTQKFQDKSVFGELTWHLMPKAQLTVGARHFSQEFTDSQVYLDFTFPIDIPPTPHEAPASKTVWKVDPSYEYAKNHFVYALWSQGFRRGGANSVPYSGIFQESPLLRFYQADTTNNYEAGLKGRFDSGLSYTLDVFDIKWNKPQISGSLPSGNLAVYNANTAESKGFEFESTGPLYIPRLSYAISYAYVDAALSSDFSLPANNGAGVVVPGELNGKTGEQLPGSPKNSASAALIYDMDLTPGYDLALSVSGVYRSAVALQVSPGFGAQTIQHSSTYEIMNFSAVLKHNSWRGTVYVTNLFDKEEVLAPPYAPGANNLANDYLVNPPREIGLRLAYSF